MRFVPFIAAALLLYSGATQAASPFDAKAYVDGLAKQVLSIATSDASIADKQHKVEEVFADKLDIDFVAKFALGKHWRSATPAQQQEYLAAYRPFILKNFAGRLTKYSGQTYNVTNARNDGEATLVSMIMHDSDGKDFSIDYRLQAKKIVDIVVEGVSLLTTQRSEFNSVVENKGLNYLIDRLKAGAAKS